MGFGQDFLKGFLGDETLRDYRHASKTFTSNQYELKPRFKFLFHVSFTINTDIPYLAAAFKRQNQDTIKELSLLVKSVDLPRFRVDTETLNQYNRKRIVQTRINYDPVNLVFHDDGGDNSRRLWYYYYTYYYKDAVYPYLTPSGPNMGADANRQAGFDYNNRDIYDDIWQIKDWGFAGETYTDGGSPSSGKPPFFKDIRIYGMDQHKYAEYVLINPVIKSWQHDRYAYADTNSFMEHTMQIEYETVKYYDGAIGNQRPDTNVQGFADPAHYDTRVSPLSRPGSTATIFGQGGLLDAGLGIIGDLSGNVTMTNVLNAVTTGARVVNTVKNNNINDVAKAELPGVLTGVLNQGIQNQARQYQARQNSIYVPTPPVDL
jgi:hypothetical protein